MDFSKWWRDLLARHGLSQEQGGREVGVTRNTSQRWANGKSAPRYKELLRIYERFEELPFKGRLLESLLGSPPKSRRKKARQAA